MQQWETDGYGGSTATTSVREGKRKINCTRQELFFAKLFFRAAPSSSIRVAACQLRYRNFYLFISRKFIILSLLYKFTITFFFQSALISRVSLLFRGKAAVCHSISPRNISYNFRTTSNETYAAGVKKNRCLPELTVRSLVSRDEK